MRVVYATMNEIGRWALEELAGVVDVVGVFTVRERGRLFMDPADFSLLAEKHRFPLHKITDINAPEVAAAIRELKPDLGMCLGWKQIIRPDVLHIPTYGWIGCHPAMLLPEGRRPDPEVFSAPGNEPLQYAIRGRFRKTGTSLQWLKETIDEGEIFAQAEVPLDEHETAATLVEKLGKATGKLVRDHMQSIIDGNPPRMKQQLEGTQPYTRPLSADDNRIDLSAPIEHTYALIRSVVYPYPNAFIDFYGTRVYVEHARMEDGRFTELKVRIGGSPYARD
ncbi:MAG TPA: formyltransferase family protein [Planctomycetota bacterium]|nr:formyltransferase family protein [Planctomycetota bacterium]